MRTATTNSAKHKRRVVCRTCRRLPDRRRRALRRRPRHRRRAAPFLPSALAPRQRAGSRRASSERRQADRSRRARGLHRSPGGGCSREPRQAQEGPQSARAPRAQGPHGARAANSDLGPDLPRRLPIRLRHQQRQARRCHQDNRWSLAWTLKEKIGAFATAAEAERALPRGPRQAQAGEKAQALGEQVMSDELSDLYSLIDLLSPLHEAQARGLSPKTIERITAASSLSMTASTNLKLSSKAPKPSSRRSKPSGPSGVAGPRKAAAMTVASARPSLCSQRPRLRRAL